MFDHFSCVGRLVLGTLLVVVRPTDRVAVRDLAPGVESLEPQRGLRGVFADRAKRSMVLYLALSMNGLLVVLSALDVFDGAPTAVLVVVYGIEVLVVLPALVAVLVFNFKDRKARRQGEAER